MTTCDSKTAEGSISTLGCTAETSLKIEQHAARVKEFAARRDELATRADDLTTCGDDLTACRDDLTERRDDFAVCRDPAFRTMEVIVPSEARERTVRRDERSALASRTLLNVEPTVPPVETIGRQCEVAVLEGRAERCE
jgi:hypothetical protein